ncbi:MAG: hypothetical protein ACE5K0_09950 [Candidatus Methanofastidiosia archaeon]
MKKTLTLCLLLLVSNIEVRSLEETYLILTNSADMDTALFLSSFLSENDFNFSIISAKEFKALKDSKYIIILGGHKAQEGIGEIVSLLLSIPEKDRLLRKEASEMFLKENIWSFDQKIVIFAGYDRELTERAARENAPTLLQLFEREVVEPPKEQPPIEEKEEMPPKEKRIQRVKINYHWTGLGSEKAEFWEVRLKDSIYESLDGVVVPEELITQLSESLSLVSESERLQSCFARTDDFPNYLVEILYNDSERVILKATSNCHLNLPWNVIRGEKLYLHQSGEIPEALFEILSTIKGESFETPPKSPFSRLVPGIIPEELELGYLGLVEFKVVFWRAMTNYQGKTLFYLGLINNLPESIEVQQALIEIGSQKFNCSLNRGGGIVIEEGEVILTPLAEIGKSEEFSMIYEFEGGNMKEGDPFKVNVFIRFSLGQNTLETDGILFGIWTYDWDNDYPPLIF